MHYHYLNLPKVFIMISSVNVANYYIVPKIAKSEIVKRIREKAGNIGVIKLLEWVKWFVIECRQLEDHSKLRSVIRRGQVMKVYVLLV